MIVVFTLMVSLVSDPGLARCMTRLDSPNLIQLTYGRHSGWPHHYPACGGYGHRKAGPVFRTALNANSRFGSLTWIHGADRAPGRRKGSDQAAFITAPSITTPEVAYFHSAIRSLRASATIVGFLRRPPLCCTRSWNQRASAEPGW